MTRDTVTIRLDKLVQIHGIVIHQTILYNKLINTDSPHLSLIHPYDTQICHDFFNKFSDQYIFLMTKIYPP